MMKMWVWYSDTAKGSHDRAAKTRSDQAMRRASGDIRSGAQERVAHDGVELVGEIPAWPFAPDFPALDHVKIVGDVNSLVDVLVHEEDGYALLPHREQLGVDLLDDTGGQTRRRLVHEEQRGLGHQL